MDFSYIFRREHAHYRKNKNVWKRCRDAYSGGQEYVDKALIRHVSEIDIEFEERRKRACFFNYPRKIARLITQFALSTPPVRSEVNSALEEDFSRTGLRTNEVMSQFSTLLNVYGSAFLAIEMPLVTGAVDPQRKEKERLRPYAMVLSPLSVPDYAYGDDGRMLWAIVEEEVTINSDPFRPATTRRRRRLWTRQDWRLFEWNPTNGQVQLVASGKHSLGVVPIIRAQESDGFGLSANHWFEDVVRISDAIMNNQSEAQMNIIKQMFGLLVISENFARKSDPRRGSSHSGNEKFSHVLARSAAIWESPDERGISRYISPSGVENTQIREENRTLKHEMFDVVGLAVNRELNMTQSAETKAWEFQNVRQFLACRVELLEQLEMQAWQLMHKWDATIPIPQVAYNRDFTVTDLKDAVAGLLELSKISDLPAYRTQIAKTAVAMLEKYRKLTTSERNLLFNAITSSGENNE